MKCRPAVARLLIAKTATTLPGPVLVIWELELAPELEPAGEPLDDEEAPPLLVPLAGWLPEVLLCEELAGDFW
jgi:hypothetical protein